MSIFREPATDAEHVLRDSCSFVLQVPPTSINLERSFVANGGDSISAMRVSPRCKKASLITTVATLLAGKSLAVVAAQSSSSSRLPTAQAEEIQSATEPVVSHAETEPFSLLRLPKKNVQKLLSEIAPALGLETSQVLDLAPTTHTQALCADAAMRTPSQGCYVFYLDIPPEIPLESITEFAQQLWNRVDILRTVFLRPPDSSDLLQAVMEQSAVPLAVHLVSEADSLQDVSESIFEESLQSRLELGALYVTFMVFDRPATPRRLAFRLSHAHFDGLSLPPILDCLSATVQGKPWPVIPKFVDYVAHVVEHNEKTLRFWRMALMGSKPLALEPTGDKSKILTSKRVIECPPKVANFTQATVFLATCAETLARLYNTRDVHFTLTVSGRTMLSENMSNTVGPCLNQVPLRMVLPAKSSLDTTVGLVRQAQLDMLQAERATLQDIYKVCTEWSKEHRKMAYNVQFNEADSRSVDLLGDGAQAPLLMHGPLGVWEHSEAVWIIASAVRDSWHIALSGNASHCTEAYLEKIANTIVAVAACVNV